MLAVFPSLNHNMEIYFWNKLFFVFRWPFHVNDIGQTTHLSAKFTFPFKRFLQGRHKESCWFHFAFSIEKFFV
jgi:hypothetical protein